MLLETIAKGCGRHTHWSQVTSRCSSNDTSRFSTHACVWRAVSLYADECSVPPKQLFGITGAEHIISTHVLATSGEPVCESSDGVNDDQVQAVKEESDLYSHLTSSNKHIPADQNLATRTPLTSNTEDICCQQLLMPQATYDMAGHSQEFQVAHKRIQNRAVPPVQDAGNFELMIESNFTLPNHTQPCNCSLRMKQPLLVIASNFGLAVTGTSSQANLKGRQ